MAIVALLVTLFAPVTVLAKSVTILRDPDIEHAIGELARPMINAAGLSPARVKVFVVHDSALNAFVVDADHIFLHSGLILKMQDASELQAVIGHELAHIANGHLARRALNLRSAKGAAAMGLVLSAIAAASGAGEAAGGLALGIASSAGRVFLSHTRAEEASADQSGMRFMAQAGIDPQGMVEVLEIFRGQEVLSASRRDPYLLSHPLNRDRLRSVKAMAATLEDRTRARPEDDYWFARARGKLEAFIRAPQSVERRIARSDNSDLARMRRAIALHRRPKPDDAIAEIAALVAMKPNDPFYAELQGQILLESRRFDAAIGAYGRAARLAPKNALILAGYGRALLAVDTNSGNKQALDVLRRAYQRDPLSPRLLRDLGMAYARAGQPGMASLVTAERYALIGRLRDAATHAKRAQGLLGRGSAGWNRAEDILHAARQVAD